MLLFPILLYNEIKLETLHSNLKRILKMALQELPGDGSTLSRPQKSQLMVTCQETKPRPRRLLGGL